MSDSTALDSFLDKWRARWPEWRSAEIFVLPPHRRVCVAWFALLQEFEDAMNIAGDPLPADAKLAWWGQELRDWAGHRSRHPLGRILEPQAAPWESLADTLPDLIAARETSADPAQAFGHLRAYAAAVVAVENALMAGQSGESAIQAVVAQTLYARAAALGDAALWATPAPGQDTAEALLGRWPAPSEAARERRLWSALARQRLQRRGSDGSAAPMASPLRLLLASWRAARG